MLTLQENISEQINSIGKLTNTVSHIHRRLDVIADAEPVLAEAASFSERNLSPAPLSRRQLPTPTPDRPHAAFKLSSSLDVRQKESRKDTLNPLSPAY